MDRFWFIYLCCLVLLKLYVVGVEKYVGKEVHECTVFTKIENGNVHISNFRAFYEYNKRPLKDRLLLQNALQTSTENILFFAESQQILQPKLQWEESNWDILEN